MTNPGSPGYDVIRLKKILESYINKNSRAAEVELREMGTIYSEDLAKALDEINPERIRKKYKELVDELEYFFAGNESPLARRVMNLVHDGRKVLE